MIVISYHTRELAHRCTKLEIAQQWLGPTNAQALVDLIADAEALESAEALIEFYDAKLREDDSLLVAFGPQCRAMLMPIGYKMPRSIDGAPVWKEVRRLMLIDIEKIEHD